MVVLTLCSVGDFLVHLCSPPRSSSTISPMASLAGAPSPLPMTSLSILKREWPPIREERGLQQQRQPLPQSLHNEFILHPFTHPSLSSSPFTLPFFLLASTHRLFLPSLLFYFYCFKSLVIRGSLLYSFLHPSSNYLHYTHHPHNINFNYCINFAQQRPSLYYYILPPTSSHYIVLQ